MPEGWPWVTATEGLWEDKPMHAGRTAHTPGKRRASTHAGLLGTQPAAYLSINFWKISPRRLSQISSMYGWKGWGRNNIRSVRMNQRKPTCQGTLARGRRLGFPRGPWLALFADVAVLLVRNRLITVLVSQPAVVGGCSITLKHRP